MQKWEHKILYGASESELNKLGDEGWELVSAVASVSGDAYSTSSSIYAYLKRSVESDDRYDSDDDSDGDDDDYGDYDEDDDTRSRTW